MVSFLFALAKVKKMSCTGMLTLLDEIFIVVIGVGTWKKKRIHREHSVSSLQQIEMCVHRREQIGGKKGDKREQDNKGGR